MKSDINKYVLTAKLEDSEKYLTFINIELINVYENLCSIMLILQENYEKNIIKKDKYNILIEKLDKIIQDYNILNNDIKRTFNNDDKYSFMGKILKMKDNILLICNECGSEKCSNLFLLYFGEKSMNYLSTEYKKLFNFYDKFFIPNSSNIEDDTNIRDICDELLPFAKKINSTNKSFLEKIEGAEIYFPFRKKYLVISGYFKKDPLNITRIDGTFHKKVLKIEDSLEIRSSSSEDNFKKKYLNQLSLRDFIIFDEDEINKLVECAKKDLIKYRTKPLSLLVKDFIASNLEKQRYILTLFLLSDSEDQFLAHIIYDMICNTSDLLKPQPMAEEIYKSLHYQVQKLFRIAFKNVESKIAQLQSLTEDDIPYDKRIAMMKASDNIKTKALDKLKEIKGTRESSAKAQQYLDGLLKIPFGINKKEPVLTFLDSFQIKIEKIRDNSKKELEEFNAPTSIQKYAKNKLLENINKYNGNLKTENLINSFINDITESFENINNFISSNQIIENNHDIDIINNGQILLNKLKKVKKLGEYLEKDELDNINIIDEDDLINDIQKDDINIILIKIEKKFVSLAEDWLQYRTDKKNYLIKLRNTLDKSVYGHDEPKQQLERLIAQWMNGKMEGTVFGFCGPPGVGKTTLAKKGLAKCLLDEDGNPRPFGFLALGGSSNGAILEGHSYTYLGSTWGRIVDILMETKCMNPIIYIDEVDKVSNTEYGREIIGILTHLTDISQNNEFADKYFAGIKFDLSKVLFIFSYNDGNSIDRILRDRITEINIKGLSLNEKINIVKNYALPEILETVGYSKNDITMNIEIIKYIIQTYTYEAGVRKLREKLFEIVREINLRKITDDNIEFPFEINKELIKEIFSDKPKVHFKKIAKEPQVGFVNGLYATITGIGGLTIIECVKTPSDRKLSLELTGQQGDVMKESMICAKTLAWNLLPKQLKIDINKECETLGPYGLHIHCPEASTPKDGPSAGIAITTGIISRLTGIKVRNDIAMTGEIDLHGNVHPIGGLDAKLEGAKRAGVKTVLIPKGNKEDYKKILKKIKEQNNKKKD